MNVDPWHFTTFFGVVLSLALIVGNAPMKWYLKIMLAYFLGYQALGFWISMGEYGPLAIATKYSSLKHLSTFLILSVLVAVPEKHLLYLSRAIYVMLALDSIWLLASGSGVFVGNTQDTLVFATFIPLIFADKYCRWLVPFLLASIILVQGAGSFVVLASHLVLLFFYGANWFIGIGGLSVACGISWYMAKYNISGERWATTWKTHLHWWGGNTDNWIGAGPGSFEWVSKIISPDAPRMWLHSDWLQIMFEYGVIGLALSLVIFSHLLWRTKSRPPEFLTIVGLGLAMMIYSPIQFFAVQYLVALIIVSGVERTA